MDVGLLIKQYISFFIQPFGMFFTIFLVGMYFLYVNKNTKAKFFLSSSFFILFLFGYPPFTNFLIKNLEDKYSKYDYKQDIKYIHVLGNGHNDDKSQPISSMLTNAGLKRVLEGVVIHIRVPNSKIIFTGSTGAASISTAMMNSKLAMAIGVKKDDIIIDETAQDTRDEASFAKKIVGDKPFVLVTSATHMQRAIKIFKSQGLHPIAAPTDFQKDKSNNLMTLPNMFSFYKSQVAMHEYFGILFEKIKHIF